jgi:hypothetical protein
VLIDDSFPVIPSFITLNQSSRHQDGTKFLDEAKACQARFSKGSKTSKHFERWHCFRMPGKCHKGSLEPLFHPPS